MSRPTYHKPSGERGKKGEIYFNEKLQKFALKKKMKCVWNNEKNNESYKKYDFSFFKNDKLIAIIECETKNPDYERYFIPNGLDLIAEKVEYLYRQQERLNIPCYYCILILGDKKYMLYLTGKAIKKYGDKIVKDNKRSLGEYFYRVPYNKCWRVNFNGKSNTVSKQESWFNFSTKSD